MLREILKLKPFVLFKSPQKPLAQAFIDSFSDSSFNISTAWSYGQNSFVACIAHQQQGSTALEYRVVDWNSSKERRICYSFYGSEILAYGDANYSSFNFRQSHWSLFGTTKMGSIRSTLYVDNKGLYDTLSTTHESDAHQMRQTIQRIRDSYE